MSMVHHHLLEDKDLVRLYQNGDQLAISELVKRYKSRIFSSILFLVRKREVAEDLFQETFIKIITCLRRDAYNEQGKFLPCQKVKPLGAQAAVGFAMHRDECRRGKGPAFQPWADCLLEVFSF